MKLHHDGSRWRLALTDDALPGREAGLALEVLTSGIDPSIAPTVLAVSRPAGEGARLAVFLEVDEALAAGLVLMAAAVERMRTLERHEASAMVRLSIEAVAAVGSPRVRDVARLLLDKSEGPASVADWATERAKALGVELRAMVRGDAA
jgi:hypothetical protein